MTKLIPTWIWAAIIAALLAVIGAQYAGNQVTVAGKNTHIASLEKRIAEQGREAAKLLSDQSTEESTRQRLAREKEQTAQAQAEAARKTTNAQINNLNRQLADARRLLDARPTRADAAASAPGELPTAAGAGPRGSAPDQLYREDAELALEIGSDAELVRVGLQACYAAYDRAEAMINAPSGAK